MTNTLLKMLREIVCAQVLCFRPEGLGKKSNKKRKERTSYAMGEEIL